MQDPKLIKNWSDKFNRYKADGIDFVASKERDQNGKPLGQVYVSYTKEEFFQREDYAYPRSHYVFWKILFGEKCYI